MSAASKPWEPGFIGTHDVDEALSELRERGAVIIRRPGASVDSFTEFTGQIINSFPHYSVATKERDVITRESHIQTVNKGSDRIPLHRESSFLPTQPDLLAFYCQQPPATGGQTTLCDAVTLLEEMPGDARAFVEGEVFIWTTRLPFERWSVALETSSQSAAAERIERLMARSAPLSTYKYHFDGDVLEGTYQCPLVLPTFWGKHPAFSNSLLQWYYREDGPLVARHLHHVTISGGRSFPADLLAVINECAERMIFETKWQAGDIVLVDNSRVMHGRRSIEDANRRIFVRIGNYRPRTLAG